MVSIKDVAELAGVSIATVSRYINNPAKVKPKTAERVREAVMQTGYAPNALAQNFRRGKTHIIVVVVPSVCGMAFEDVMEGIWDVAREHNYSVLVRETRNRLEFDEFTRLLLSRQADGVVLLASLSPFEDANLDHRNAQHPPVMLGLEAVLPELGDFPSVRIDNEAAATEVARHLIELGHRNIAMIYGKPHEGSTLTSAREVGFRSAMADANLEVAEEAMQDGKMTIQGGRDAIKRILQCQPRPTAVFCANDEMAIGALHEIKLAGLKVPDDISVVGFDNSPIAEVCDPPLTTIRQPFRWIGMRVMERLFAAINGGSDDVQLELASHELVVRASTAPPP